MRHQHRSEAAASVPYSSSICLLESNGHTWQGSLETVQLDVRAILAGTLTGEPVVTSADGEVSI